MLDCSLQWPIQAAPLLLPTHEHAYGSTAVFHNDSGLAWLTLLLIPLALPAFSSTPAAVSVRSNIARLRKTRAEK